MPNVGKSRSEWNIRLRQYAKGVKFGPGEAPGKLNHYARSAVVAIDKCPAQLNEFRVQQTVLDKFVQTKSSPKKLNCVCGFHEKPASKYSASPNLTAARKARAGQDLQPEQAPVSSVPSAAACPSKSGDTPAVADTPLVAAGSSRSGDTSAVTNLGASRKKTESATYNVESGQGSSTINPEGSVRRQLFSSSAQDDCGFFIPPPKRRKPNRVCKGTELVIEDFADAAVASELAVPVQFDQATSQGQISTLESGYGSQGPLTASQDFTTQAFADVYLELPESLSFATSSNFAETPEAPGDRAEPETTTYRERAVAPKATPSPLPEPVPSTCQSLESNSIPDPVASTSQFSVKDSFSQPVPSTSQSREKDHDADNADKALREPDVSFGKGVRTTPKKHAAPASPMKPRQSPSYISYLAAEIRNDLRVPPEDLEWIARVLYERGKKLKEKFSLWYYPDPAPGPQSHALPAPEDYFRRRLCVWSPLRSWGVELRCPRDKALLSKRGFHKRLRIVVDFKDCYYLMTELVGCSRCNANYLTSAPCILEQLEAGLRDRFPALLTKNYACDLAVVSMLRSRTRGNSSTAFCNNIQEIHSEEWLKKLEAYLGACDRHKKMQVFGAPAVEYVEPNNFVNVPSPRWFNLCYIKDVYARSTYIRASLSSTFGTILKIDSTKKVTGKLQGEAKGTAMWCTNVGNENGEVLTCLFTNLESVAALQKMADGLMNRYAEASVPPPRVLYTDRDCCRTSADLWRVDELAAELVKLQGRSISEEQLNQISDLYKKLEEADKRSVAFRPFHPTRPANSIFGRHGFRAPKGAQATKRAFLAATDRPRNPKESRVVEAVCFRLLARYRANITEPSFQSRYFQAEVHYSGIRGSLRLLQRELAKRGASSHLFNINVTVLQKWHKEWERQQQARDLIAEQQIVIPRVPASHAPQLPAKTLPLSAPVPGYEPLTTEEPQPRIMSLQQITLQSPTSEAPGPSGSGQPQASEVSPDMRPHREGAYAVGDSGPSNRSSPGQQLSQSLGSTQQQVVARSTQFHYAKLQKKGLPLPKPRNPATCRICKRVRNEGNTHKNLQGKWFCPEDPAWQSFEQWREQRLLELAAKKQSPAANTTQGDGAGPPSGPGENVNE